MKNYYKILDLSYNATVDDIRKRYRKLALICHPDKQKKDEYNYSNLFIDINEAYKILSNSKKRCIYDSEFYYYIKNKENEEFTNILKNSWLNKNDIKTDPTIIKSNKTKEKNKIYKNSIEEIKYKIYMINYKFIISIILNLYIWLVYNL